MLKIIILFLLIAIAQAAQVTYIMAFKPPVTEDSFKQAKADVEAAGGKVTYEFRTAFKAVLVELPEEQITTFRVKPYVDFMEPDKLVHTQ